MSRFFKIKQASSYRSVGKQKYNSQLDLISFNLKGIVNHVFGVNRTENHFSHRSNICCPRDCVSRHNGAPRVPPLNPS